jgi:hypothetical protein
MKVSCPQCGGNNQIEIPDTFTKCSFCKNSLYIDIDEITVVYSFNPTIDSSQLMMYLKRDFDKIGFNEKIEICDSKPVYFPFWQIEGSNKLSRGSSAFPEESIIFPSGEKIFFEPQQAVGKNIEIKDIDTQPEISKGRTLLYVPYFKVIILFNNQRYSFFINAVNGEVQGDPIPYISSDKTSILFPLFIAIFILFLIINSIFNNMGIALVSSVFLLFMFFQISLNLLEKKYYKK